MDYMDLDVAILKKAVKLNHSLTLIKVAPQSLHCHLKNHHVMLNSLVPGRCRCNLKLVIFKLTSRVAIFSISCEIALRWMPQDFTDDKSTLVQVMAWCRQASSHYLSQCWPRSMLPNGVTRPQWVNRVITAPDCILYNIHLLILL